jgi:ATP-grasp domain, R2K clade family 2
MLRCETLEKKLNTSAAAVEDTHRQPTSQPANTPLTSQPSNSHQPTMEPLGEPPSAIATGIAIQSSDWSFEAKCLRLYASEHKIPSGTFRKHVPPGWVVYGNVDWVEDVLKIKSEPDYYPDFLSAWVKRKIWRQDKWPLGQKVFIKPADRNKRFTGFVTNGTYRGKKKGPYWCSEVVTFTNEWRYYVSNGKVVYAKWYYGIGTATPIPAPILDIKWPDEFSGCVDFGSYPDGEIALIEVNPPYSCGWYGSIEEYAIFAEFIINGQTRR